MYYSKQKVLSMIKLTSHSDQISTHREK